MTSTAFEPGGAIPDRFSCQGENVPPPLRSDGVPAGIDELALVVEDPDAPDGTFVHWLVVGIDPDTTAIEPGGPLPAGSCPAALTTRPTSGPAHRTETAVTATSSRSAPCEAPGRWPMVPLRWTRSVPYAGRRPPVACSWAPTNADGRRSRRRDAVSLRR